MINEPTTFDAVPPLRTCTPEEADAFVERLKAEGYDYLRFELSDMAGLSRGKTVPLNHVAGYLKSGLNLYGGTVAMDTGFVPVHGSGYNEEMNYQDGVMVADLDTLSPVPWLERTGRVICDTMWYDGKVQLASPRMLLKKMLMIADQMGYKPLMGHEYEFYVVDAATRQPLWGSQPIFATIRTHQYPELDDLIRVLQAEGIDIITTNVEHGPGQVEINYAAEVGVAASDTGFKFKNTVKEYLLKRGILATFMTKPYKGKSGSCSHFHISLLDKETGENVFLDKNDPDGMSDVFKSFIQGVLDHTRGAMAIWSPTPNCYRRIRPRTYAPSNISWGIQDRSASVRVKASKDKATHMEIRVPAAMANPYLIAATAIASGLLGIIQKRKLMPAGQGPKEDDASYAKLPTEMADALDALEADTALCEMLGDEFIKVYLATKWQEAMRLRDEIPPAETNEYFELY